MEIYRISDQYLWQVLSKEIGDQSGIYRLHCLDSADAGFVPVSRILREDPDGVLYIGSSRILRSRIASLRKALSASAGQQGFTDFSAHVCGHKYKSSELQRSFPYERLCVTLHLDSAYDVAEILALYQYEELYGEAPPFNEGRPKAKWAAAG